MFIKATGLGQLVVLVARDQAFGGCCRAVVLS